MSWTPARDRPKPWLRPHVATTVLVGLVDARPGSGFRVEKPHGVLTGAVLSPAETVFATRHQQSDGQRCGIGAGDAAGMKTSVAHLGFVLVVHAVTNPGQGDALVTQPHKGHVVHQAAGRGAILAYGEGKQGAVEVRRSPRRDHAPARPGLRHPRIRHPLNRCRREDPVVGSTWRVAVRSLTGDHRDGAEPAG